MKLNPHAIIRVSYLERDQEGNPLRDADNKLIPRRKPEIYDSWKDKGLFESVEVDLTTDQASQATWKIVDPQFKFTNKWTRHDGLDLMLARIWLGLGENLGETVFRGFLASAECERFETTFKFYDESFLMRSIQHTEYHRNLDDLQIIEKLAKRNGLQFEKPTPEIKLDKHKSVIQDAQTDWDHAQERARDIGVVLYTRGNTLFAKEAAKTSEPVLVIVNNRDPRQLAEWSLYVKVPENQQGRPGEVNVRARGRGGRSLHGRSNKTARGARLVEIRRDLPIKSKRQADRRAQAKKDLQREHAFTGTIHLLSDFEGKRPDVRDTIELLDFGNLFSHRWLCDKVQHSFGPGRLHTEIEIYKDAKAPEEIKAKGVKAK